MAFSLAPLLVHSESIPVAARNALRGALESAPEKQSAELLAAARLIHQDTDLDCGDARELVGLEPCGSCG